VSWYQPDGGPALRRITEHLADRSAPIIDVGTGASVLPGELLAAGYTDLTAVEISPVAIGVAQKQLGGGAGQVLA
jgi:ribosomal protein L11 methylase PrmA